MSSQDGKDFKIVSLRTMDDVTTRRRPGSKFTAHTH